MAFDDVATDSAVPALAIGPLAGAGIGVQAVGPVASPGAEKRGAGTGDAEADGGQASRAGKCASGCLHGTRVCRMSWVVGLRLDALDS